MTACLDTNVLVDILNGRHRTVRKRYEAEFGSSRPIVIPSLAAHELFFGALISRRPQHHADQARLILSDHEIVELSGDDALAAARLRADLRGRGLAIGSFDTLIAGQALNRGWTLVTANIGEFARIDGLAVEDWTAPG